MRILILSNTPWNNNNSFGNTFSNLFEGLDDIEIANIYCKSGLPSNSCVSRYFQITEKSLIKNLKNKAVPSGKEVTAPEKSIIMSNDEQKKFDKLRKYRFQPIFWARDLIWKVGRWESPELKKFIDDFSPDLLYLPLYYSNGLLDISLFLTEYCNCRAIGHISDDNYSLRQFSLSPLFWLNRFIIRSKLRKVVKKCEFLHVISDIQKNEYEKMLNKECRVFKKSHCFENEPKKHELNSPLKVVYTGNIGGGRWQTLALIGKALDEANKDGVKAQLFIYTFTPLTGRMKKALAYPNTVFVMGGVPSCEVLKIQQNADILVHVESFKLKERLWVHQSFSTKIVDYLHTGNCIFAVGTKDMAFMDYLVKNDAAVTALGKNNIEKNLKRLISSPDLIREYGEKAWLAGKKNHEHSTVSAEFMRDLKDAVCE